MLAPRIALAHARTRLLTGTAGIIPPTEPPGFRHVYYLYTVICGPACPSGTRDRIRRLLDLQRVGTVVANRPTYAANRLIAGVVARSGGADDVGTVCFGDLHGEMADSAGRGVDEHTLCEVISGPSIDAPGLDAVAGPSVSAASVR